MFFSVFGGFGHDCVGHGNSFCYVIAHFFASDKGVDTGLLQRMTDALINAGKHHMYAFAL